MEPHDNVLDASDRKEESDLVEEANDPNIFSEDTDSKIVDKSTLASDISETVVGCATNPLIAFAQSEACFTTDNANGSKPCNLDVEAGLPEASSTTLASSDSYLTIESENSDDLTPCNLSVEAGFNNAPSTTLSKSAASLPVAIENPGSSKPCNLTVEAGLSKVLPKVHNETRLPTSEEISSRHSVSENQLLSSIARLKGAQATDVATSGLLLLETIHKTLDVLHANVETFLEKASVIQGRGNADVDFEVSEYYRNLASKYEDAVKKLQKRGGEVEVAMKRAEEYAGETFRSADVLEKSPDDASEEARLARFRACKWKNKSEEAIVLLLQKQHAALVTMRTIWLNVKEDIKEDGESSSATSRSSSAVARIQQQDCYRFEARARKMNIAHVVGFFIGVSLLACTSLFRFGSDSFNAVLVLGLLITGWTTMYWIRQLYRYIRFRKKQSNAVATGNEQTECEDAFLVNVNSRLAIVEDMLQKHKAAPLSDSSSESGGSHETVRIGDTSQ